MPRKPFRLNTTCYILQTFIDRFCTHRASAWHSGKCTRIVQVLRLLPARAKVAGWDSHALKDRAFARRTNSLSLRYVLRWLDAWLRASVSGLELITAPNLHEMTSGLYIFLHLVSWLGAIRCSSDPPAFSGPDCFEDMVRPSSQRISWYENLEQRRHMRRHRGLAMLVQRPTALELVDALQRKFGLVVGECVHGPKWAGGDRPYERRLV